MSTIGSEEMKGILAQLGIQSTNSGASTGSNWMNTTGATIDSISPVDGKLIETGVLNGSKINVSTLQKGLYILQLEVDGKKKIKKIIKK